MSDISSELVIGDDNFQSQLSPRVDGKPVTFGLVPRNMNKHPRGCYKSIMAVDIPLIPREEWPERIEEMEATKSRLSDIRMTANNGGPIPSLNQGSEGYCWTHGPAHAVMMLRAIANHPYVPLSGHSVGCKVKNFRNEGAWGALALDFISKHGIMPQTLWPEQSMSRSHDTPENWNRAADFRFTESWVDLQAPVYDRDLSRDQIMSAILSRLPVPGDFMWWGHHVLMLDPVDVYKRRSATDTSRYGFRIWNSWGDRYGTLGMGVLKDTKAWPDNAVCPRQVIGE